MIPPKVDVSAVEASTSLVNNKSVAFADSIASSRGYLSVQLVRRPVCTRSCRQSHTRVSARVLAGGLMQTGSHDDVTDVELNLTMRGQTEFVGLEFAQRERESARVLNDVRGTRARQDGRTNEREERTVLPSRFFTERRRRECLNGSFTSGPFPLICAPLHQGAT